MAGSTLKENKIRERASYEMFYNINKAFKKSSKEGLKALFNELDSRKKFGTLTHSLYAKESLELLIEDESL